MKKTFKLIVAAFLVGAAIAIPVISYANQSGTCVWCYDYYSPDERNWCTLSGVDFETQSCSYNCSPLNEGQPVPESGGPFPYCELNCRMTETGVVCDE